MAPSAARDGALYALTLPRQRPRAPRTRLTAMPYWPCGDSPNAHMSRSMPKPKIHDLFARLEAEVASGATKSAGAKRRPGNGPEDEYGARHIEVLEGLEPVRRRPGMYIGGTDEKALHHLFAEALDNAMDEAVAGFATRIELE